MKNWKQYSDNTIECQITLNATLDEIMAFMWDEKHLNFWVKAAYQINKFRQEINTYHVILRDVFEGGPVIKFLKNLKTKPVTFAEFKNEILRLETFADAKVF